MAYRRRRTLLLLAVVLAAEITGVCVVAPGFWVPLSVTAFLLVAYVVHLRNRALLEQRRRRAAARYERWIRARQAAVRREQARRAAARRELLERQLAAREEERRHLLRGRPYETRAAGQ
jgi:hypothetical protein